ncbi:sigma-Y antisigma factor component [Paenibacillus mesophilus]|uniref:sigma-Y antisigma factor component n=1 Tax=Paenibacillus mesophilus TaxID=2582849 RepID=UPI00110E801A|nr:sigma-Y antisigma factor component [Paenibacillus mesophilus]TMV49325.1 sigma-Y antisigma factor component [Paenibacillus mesophilus]
MTEATHSLPLWVLPLVALVLLTQSTFLFLDARKQGSHPWLWGLWGLIQCPIPLIVYWIVVHTSLFRKKKQ